MAFPVHFSASVTSIVRHNPNLATFVMLPTGRFPKFKPGHFVQLTLEPYDPSQHWPESRAFSVASAPSNKQELRLTIGRQGAYTGRILNEVREGQTLSLKGPYGDFVVAPQEPSDHIVLVAGGTGITPFCSYLEELALKPDTNTHPVHVFYAVREQEQFIYRELVENCRKHIPNVQVHYFCENKAHGADIPARLSCAQILERLPCRQESRFYLSGPQSMIKAFSEELMAQHGVAANRVHIDAWQ
jgi:ferredoxin-NADP reductase